MIQLKAYRPGTYVCINNQTYYILSVHIELVESGMSYEMAQMLTLLAVDDNAENMGKEAITLNIDMYDIEEL